MSPSMLRTCGALVLLWVSSWTGLQGYVRVCYYVNWSQFRPDPVRLLPEDVNPALCTHLVFAFSRVLGTSLTTTVANDPTMYGRVLALKEENPDLRVLLSVGGWAEGGREFSTLVSSERSMLDFVNNTILYLRRFGFDGLDIDWEYPGDAQRGSRPTDRFLFTRLLKLLREGFEDEAADGQRDRLLLTVAVAPEVSDARRYYHIPGMGRYVDFVNMMAYDFHGDWDLDSGARHHSALYPETHAAVQGWLGDGFPPDKLVLGMAGFARTFTLAARPEVERAGVGQEATGGGLPGHFSHTGGLLIYPEVKVSFNNYSHDETHLPEGQICDLLGSGGWQRVWLEEQQAPVAFGTTIDGSWIWAGYDDTRSIAVKAAYVRDNGLAGGMLWNIGTDDVNNRCGDGSWPLLTILKQQLPSGDLNISTTTGPDVSTTNSTPTPVTVTAQADSITSSGSNNSSNRSPSAEVTGSTTRRKDPTTSSGDPMSTPGPIPKARIPDTDPGYRQCRISGMVGPSLRCTNDGGKTDSRSQFYLFCFDGFFAIECSCMPGFSYNRCVRSCDADVNFYTCPHNV